ncbi:hypothetical protein PHMEG_00014759 [Phytophthora megakarya]|uniref:PiggyBac transposable element-derived protein domain-containing protein n=1 Tax=Phytophthora megakarya TaxID=4795 RepID=A0A225W3I6_9STRA|nr:hypothetical protein PHMEG_00014759 [Phytophthora megakarya]
MIPSRSRHNVTRHFMKDKPHKWSTKLEVFCGTEQHSDELGGESLTQYSTYPNSGPAAVIRNLSECPTASERRYFRAVVTDRFYTSVQLALQLLECNVYTVGKQKGLSARIDNELRFTTTGLNPPETQ